MYKRQPLTREAVDELENYVLEFGIDHYKWERERDVYKRQGVARFMTLVFKD